MSKVICDVCGTTYPETAEQCPICGCSKVLGGRMAAEAPTLSEEFRSKLKGGRFTNEKQREPEYYSASEMEEEEEEPVEKPALGRTILIVSLLVVFVAILAVSGYLLLRYYLPNAVPPVLPLETTQETTQETTAPPIPCESLTLTNSTVELDKQGQAWLLNVVVLPENTTDQLMYASSDESVVTVTEHGRINGVGPGEAIITVTCGSQQLTCTVFCTFTVETEAPTVEETLPAEEATEAFALNREDITFFAIGESFRFSAGAISMNQITWTSADPSVATIVDGTVTAVAPGTTTVTAEYQGQTATCIIRCKFDTE